MTHEDMEFEQTLADGRTVLLTFTRETEWDIDRHWGADADGRRGVPMIYCSDDRAFNVKAFLLMDDAEQPTEVTPEMVTLVDQYLAEMPPEYEKDAEWW